MGKMVSMGKDYVSLKDDMGPRYVRVVNDLLILKLVCT